MSCKRIFGFHILVILTEEIVSAPLIRTDHATTRVVDTTMKNTVAYTPYKRITDMEGAAEYLNKYGYSKPGISKNSGGYEDQLKKSIKMMQKNFDLNVTGELDNNTLAVMNSPRCSLPDVVTGTDRRQKRYIPMNRKRWRSKSVFYRVVNHPTITSQFDNDEEIDDAIDEGFKIWTTVESINLYLIRTFRDSANINLGFYKSDHGDSDPFYPTTLILGHAFFPYDGRVHINDYYNWSKRENYSLRQVTAHEVGHAIGLEHSFNTSDVMYPVHYHLKDFKLSDGDVRAVLSFYGPNVTYNDYPPCWMYWYYCVW